MSSDTLSLPIAPVVCRDPNRLSREMLAKYTDFCAQVDVTDVKFVLTETFRTKERQAWLWDQGRSVPGKIRTWTLYSRHTTGDAFDVLVIRNKAIVEDGDDMQYRTLGRIGMELGLKWGVTHKDGRRIDTGHFELKTCNKEATQWQS